eukprot:scaffold27241_cov114-Isochrysis_galbana.AAC.3
MRRDEHARPPQPASRLQVGATTPRKLEAAARPAAGERRVAEERIGPLPQIVAVTALPLGPELSGEENKKAARPMRMQRRDAGEASPPPSGRLPRWENQVLASVKAGGRASCRPAAASLLLRGARAAVRRQGVDGGR